jgi:membrane protein YqaA with SNARE-associated domain
MGKKIDALKTNVKNRVQNLEVKKKIKNIETKLQKIDLFIMSIIVGVMLVSLLGYLYLQKESVTNVLEYGVFGLFIISFLLEFFPQFIAPQLLLPISISAGINPHAVLFFSVIGSALGAILGFHVGRIYGLSIFKRFLKQKKIDTFQRLVARYGKIAVFLTAISPFPYLPIVFGSLGVSWKDFLVYGLIPRALGFAVVVYGFYLGIYTPVFV